MLEVNVRWWLVIAAVVVIPALPACGPRKPACPEPTDGMRFLTGEELAVAMSAAPAPFPGPIEVQVGRKRIIADKVVSGPLCNDEWRGTVYVACQAKVAEWSETPAFLEGCELDIEEGTVVYVAAHNNAAYYEGCSCHTGEIGGP